MRTALRTVVAAALLCVLPGCWDRREINDVAFVAATGVDEADGLIRISVQYPLPGQMGGAGSAGGGGGTAGAKPWHVEAAEGRTGREANAVQQSGMSRYLNFSHRRVLILGEELARSGISIHMDILGRIPQNRMTAYLFVARGKAEPILSSETSLEKMPAERIRELASLSHRKPVTIETVTNALLTDGLDPYIPCIGLRSPDGESGSKAGAALTGTALFKDDRLVRILSGDASKGLMLALEQLKQPVVTVSSPEGRGYISVQLMNAAMSVDADLRGLTPSFRLALKGNIVTSENSSSFRFSDNDRTVAQLESAVNRFCEQAIRMAVESTQELGVDPLGLGQHLHRHHPETWRKVKDRWRDVYAGADIRIDARVKFRHPGTLTYPLGISKEDLRP